MAHNGEIHKEIYLYAREKLSLDENIIHLHVKDSGLGSSCREGIKKIESEYGIITAVDLPFQFSDVENIIKKPELLKYDIIIGSKSHRNSLIVGRSLKRKISSAIFNILKKFILDFKLPKDTQGTLIFKNSVGKKIAAETISNDYFFTTEFIFLALKNGYQITEVPVTYIENDEKSSSVSIYKLGIKFIIELFKLKLRSFNL